ncbi:MAG TPA: 3-deoxy-7-phosphoheptulonate synthase class II [Polyangiaceae bacterium]|nr:3-deoxy-7-phosphoheptulonate synthase class II [Polyangiaceae bacterium]
MDSWHPASWQSKVAEQQPKYPDGKKLERVVAELSRLPPLVTSWEVETLKAKLAKAASGEMFVLQGGDCAESFDECEPGPITAKLKILLQMSLVLVHGARKPVVRIGRIAGQYAKPRSADDETRDGVTLPAYRGDIVNRAGFSAEERGPDPDLLLRGYERAALTLNFVRALSAGGFADLHHPETWDLGFAQSSSARADYERIVHAVRESLQFMESLTGYRFEDTNRVDFYTSHEGLSLSYEQAQTREVPRRSGWYNLSTHFPWIGMRTAKLDGAHVEYFRGIENPIAVKVGPAMTDEWIKGLIEVLDPKAEPGRLTFIHRLGAGKVADRLPGMIAAVRATGRRVAWIVDAMHGNTETTQGGIKTRRFDKILSEIEAAFDIHRAEGSHLGGVHFELTGDNVTECVGGARGLSEDDLKRAYKSKVDPRLNAEQALEMAMLIATRSRT